MTKQTIKNRNGKTVVILAEHIANPNGLAFVMHGLGGSKDQKHIEMFAKAFTDKNISVVRFDTTNSFGESDGNYEDATATNYLEDLEDVIKWASSKPWYKEPFWLAGHSLGGMCISLYAEANPNKVKGLAPISASISGKLIISSSKNAHLLEEWERTGWRVETKSDGRTKRLKWSHVADRMKYDITKKANKLSMPVLMIVGSEDTSTPIEHEKILYNSIPEGQKEFHIIDGAPHTFTEKHHLAEVYTLFDQWIEDKL
jgi:pimeloyl-ACP methyl ester carboxylesterase